MQAEEARKAPPANVPAHSPQSTGRKEETPRRVKKTSWTLPPVSARLSSPSSLQNSPTDNGLNAIVTTLADIQAGELSGQREQRRLVNRPLQLIQLEEQAVRELAIAYEARDNPEYAITVERCTTLRADPMWVPS